MYHDKDKLTSGKEKIVYSFRKFCGLNDGKQSRLYNTTFFDELNQLAELVVRWVSGAIVLGSNPSGTRYFCVLSICN